MKQFPTHRTLTPLTVACCLFFSPLIFAKASEMKPSTTQESANPTVEQAITVGRIWPAVRVGFCLLTQGDRQYVAYYNADRRMTVAVRSLNDEKFTEFVLPSKSNEPPKQVGPSSTIQGWDSHNYITMTIDSGGDLHLAGNMHAGALTYFRTDKPGDFTTLRQVDPMVGKPEGHCTYPRFMSGPEGVLLFHYRDGYSGNGQEIYNAYDVQSRTWRRFLDKPLISGLGKSSAYQRGPVFGPDGWYHLIWMWRDTSAVETNHDLSYARSRNLKDWETAGGEPLPLPITINNKNTVIDPVPVKGGLHNSNHQIAFDSKGRAVVSYFKHDPAGNTQAYVARFDGGKWKTHQVSQWEGHHLFSGGGSGASTFGTSLSLGTLRKYGTGKLSLPFDHWKAGSGSLVIDEETLALIEVARSSGKTQRYPADLVKVKSNFPGMLVNWAESLGKPTEAGVQYVLRWETLGTNRDRPREGALPPAGDLVLYKIKTAQ